MKNYYQILDVAPDASLGAIREQYRLLIQAWHPDKFSNPDQKKKAEAKAKEFNEAYTVLSNPTKRAQYDEELSFQTSSFDQEEGFRRERAESERRQADEQKRRAQTEVERIRAEAERRRKAQAEAAQRLAEEKRKRNRKAAFALAILTVLFLSAYALISMFRPCGWLDNLLGNPTGCVSAISYFSFDSGPAVFSSDGTLVTMKSPGHIMVWQVKNGESVFQFQSEFLFGQEHDSWAEHGMRNEVPAFSPDGHVLAASHSGDVILWEVSSGKHLYTFPYIQGNEYNWVQSMDFSPDGKLLVANFAHGPAKVWKLADYSLLYMLDVNNSVFSPDGNLLAAGIKDGVALWRVSDGKTLQTLKSTGRASVVEFSPDGQLLASWERDSGIRLWRISDGRLLTTMKIDFPDSTFVSTEEFAQHLYFSPDGKILVAFIDNVIWSDDSILFWQVESGELLRTVTIRGQWNHVFGIGFHPDGKLLTFQDQNVAHDFFRDDLLDPYLYPDQVILELEPRGQ